MDIAIKYNIAQLNTTLTTSISLKEYLKVCEKQYELKQQKRLCNQLISSELSKFKVQEGEEVLNEKLESGDEHAIRYDMMIGMRIGKTLTYPKYRERHWKKAEELLNSAEIKFVKTTWWDADLECFEYHLIY